MYLWSVTYFFSPISRSYHSPTCIIHQNIHCNCFICKVIHKYKTSYFTKLVQNLGRQQPLSCFLFSECLIKLTHAATYVVIVLFPLQQILLPLIKGRLIKKNCYSIHCILAIYVCFVTKAAVCEPTQLSLHG